MTTGNRFKAHMFRTWDGAKWAVIVVTSGGVSTWPDVRLPAANGIPSQAARASALQTLGFAVTSGDPYPWEWTETEHGEEPRTRVSLIATATVTPLGTDPAPAT